LAIVLLTLAGCSITTDREQLYYTRSDVDAITTGIQCRQLARNLVEISRCDTVRR
jgi:hypothetical protein